jgi:transposase
MSSQQKKACPNPTTASVAPNPARRPSGRRTRWEIKNPNAAGIDVGSTSHYVAVPPDSVPETESPVRCFGAFTPELHKMVEWLNACGVKTVAMESTGVYWISLYQVLEQAGLEVVLVNARHVKHVPQRKTDVSDSQWLQQLHSYGLLSASFRPQDEICRLRSLTRHRANLVSAAAAEVQHIQKALLQMNLHLHHVVSDVMGATGRRILEAILAGKRDPEALLELRDRQITKSTREQMKAALVGDYRWEHLFVLQQAYQAYQFWHRQMDECDEQIGKMLKEIALLCQQKKPQPAQPAQPAPEQEALARQDARPKPEPASTTPESPSGKCQTKKKAKQTPKANDPKIDFKPWLAQIFGIDLTETLGLRVLSVLVLLSEVGFDLSRFPNAKAFSSWLGLCPNNKISGGRLLSSRTRHVVNRASVMLRIAAMAVGRTDTCLGWFYRRKAMRLGPAAATTATARKLACIIYHLIKHREIYIEPDLAQYQRRYYVHRTTKLTRQLENLGFEVTLKPKAQLDPQSQPC